MRRRQTDLPPVAGLERNGAAPVPGTRPGGFQGPCHGRQCLGLVVRALSRRGAAAAARSPDAIRASGLFVGINYKDAARQRPALPRPLRQSVRPASGADANGRAAIEWGVYGVPETFMIGRDGRIAYKLVGPITPDNLDSVIKPQIAKALRAGS